MLFFPARPLSHTLNLLCCHRVGAHGGGPALPARLPCLSVYNRCLCSAGTNGIQSVSLGNDRVAGLTPRPVIYLSMVSNRGVVGHDVGTTDQSDALLSRAGEGWQGLVNKDVGIYRPSGSSIFSLENIGALRKSVIFHYNMHLWDRRGGVGGLVALVVQSLSRGTLEMRVGKSPTGFPFQCDLYWQHPGYLNVRWTVCVC